jgi:hypothetical protein
VFYEEALRTQADSVAVRALRQREELIARRRVGEKTPQPEDSEPSLDWCDIGFRPPQL